MKRFLFVLIFSVFSMASLQAQFAKSLKSRTISCHNKSSFSLGVTGCFAANDMMYSAVSKAKLSPYLAPTVGLAFEWNTMKIVSVGLDASYAMRGTNKVFATEFLTSYTTSTFSRVHYTLAMKGVEIRIPVTFYLSGDETIQPYFYVAPRFNLWLNGNLHWERTYDDESYAPLVYDNEVNDATMAPYEFGAVAGLGLCSRILIQSTQFFLKFDLSYGINVLSDFSKHEVNEDVVFQGWGDIEHETLGQRRLHDLEARLTLLIPFGKHLKDACAFDQQMKKGK